MPSEKQGEWKRAETIAIVILSRHVVARWESEFWTKKHSQLLKSSRTVVREMAQLQLHSVQPVYTRLDCYAIFLDPTRSPSVNPPRSASIPLILILTQQASILYTIRQSEKI